MVLAGAGAVLMEWSLARNLREENAYLAGLKEENGRLAQQNQEIPRLREAREEIDKLSQANGDLYRLRSEVHQLREQKTELARLQVENQQLQKSLKQNPATPATVVPLNMPIRKENLAYAGLATPEAAFQTFCWAMREGRVDILRTTVIPSEDMAKDFAKSDDDLRKKLTSESSGMPDFQVLERVESGTNVFLKIQMSRPQQGAQASDTQFMPFSRVGADWKLDMSPKPK